MIDKKHAGNEVARLIGLDFFPTKEAAITELVTALRMSDTEVIATAVINAWLEESTQRPTPADLHRLVASHNEARRAKLRQEQESVTVRHNCPRCQDFGYFGGYLPPHPYAGPWKWCDCHAAAEKRDREPGLVDDANAVRDKPIARFAHGTFRGAKRNGSGGNMQPLTDFYFGEF